MRTHEFVVGWAEMWVVRVPHLWLASKVGARIGELVVGIGKGIPLMFGISGRNLSRRKTRR